MGRPLRHLPPGTLWFVTTRCERAQFLLRPDAELTALVGLWLARAARTCPGISLHAVVALSNHLHLIVCDQSSELSTFMAFFLGNLARAVNRLRDRYGHVFERRFSSEPILDEEAQRERLLYTLLNPVTAGLVPRHTDWRGQCLWASSGQVESHPLEPFNRACHEVARGQTPSAVALRADREEQETLTIVPLPVLAARSGGTELMALELRTAEDRIAATRQREGKGFLGMRRVMSQDPIDAPRAPKRHPRPLCHTASLALWQAYRALRDLLRRAYAAASHAFRAGDFRAEFPPHVFRPPELRVTGLGITAPAC